MSTWDSLAESIDDHDYFESSSFSASPIEIALDLGSFATAPYMWPHLADKITCDWEADNISNCKVYLEGIEGTRVLLNDNQPGVAKQRPTGKATKYAGSWAQDYGASITTDQGDDATVDGLSAGVASDPEMACALQLLADRTATKLVYVVTPTDPDQPVVIEYPRFEYTLSADRKHVYENAHQCATIHPNGPGVRTGMWDSGTSGTVLSVPDLYDGTTRPNLVDYLVTERLLLRGMAPLDGLTTELASLYDTYEERSVGSVRSNSHGFWLPPNGGNWLLAMVNSVAECPPLSNLPRRERGSDWAETGSFAQYTWAHHQDGHYYVNPARAVELRADDDTTVWSAPSSSVLGWAVTRHGHSLDNTEADFGIWLAGKRFAKEIRPWRGYFMSLPLPVAGAITYVAGADGEHNRAYIDEDGYVVSERADNSVGSWTPVTLAFTATDVHLSRSLSGQPRLWLSYSDGVKVYERVSVDGGRSFGDAEEIGTGERMVTVPLSHGGHFRYWHDGTDILGEEIDANGDVVGTSFTALEDADERFDAFASSDGRMGFRVVLQIIESGTPAQYTARDGRNFA